MKLSVIIVNYNVKYFLEQCLYSVRKASQNLFVETIVVDNNSVDGSVQMVKEKFPDVILIENKENKGFASANNQAIRKVKGEYILLLNPDTIVEEDTFEKTLKFMDDHPDAGALGVKMIDGSGKFLPESKRGLPAPAVAFFKIVGLSRLFPKSRLFGKYHLGYLDKEKIHKVEILAGAFMLIRKKVLDQIGLLDETFFMYGEDIDISYRITQAGYKNYYFPETRIIHYKGESTKKSSVNYVMVFYRAMIIFAQKHFSHKNATLFSFLINLAIYIRASIAIFNRVLKKIILPVTDGILIYWGIFFIKEYWEQNIKMAEGVRYPPEYLLLVVPSYMAVWLASVYLSGGYDKPVSLVKTVRGLFTGTILILVIYALLPESYRFSRALILLGAVWAMLSTTTWRMFLNIMVAKDFILESSRKKRLLIVGGESESNRVLSLLKLTENNTNFIGFVTAKYPLLKEDSQAHINGFRKYCLGSTESLGEIIKIYQIDEIIFCAKDITSQQIINHMLTVISDKNIEYKIVPPESLYIIGSNSVDTTGELYTIDINSITKLVNKRNKRVFDILFCFFILVTLPLNFFVIIKPFGLLKNVFKVLFRNYSWVGYSKTISYALPSIKKGILSPADILESKNTVDGQVIERLNMLYAKDYRIYNDMNIILKKYRFLGKRV